MNALNKAALIAKYVEIRDQIKAIESEQIAPLKAMLDKIETYFKAIAAVEGVDSWKTDGGTAYLVTTDSVRLADPAAYMEYIIENDAWDLLEKRASKTAVRSFLETHKVLPPGAEITTRIEVNIRRPNAAN